MGVDLSIVIPTYNRAALLSETLSSLARQRSKNFTVFVVDHGSHDSTEEAVSGYSGLMHLEYFRIPHKSDSPGEPRDFGAAHSGTRIVAFLDSGMVVPSCYVLAHTDFHRRGAARVGIGMCHGHNPWSPGYVPDLAVDASNIDQVAELIMTNPTVRDYRLDVNLAQLSQQWVFAWSGNLSLSKEVYLSVGGFDPDQVFGYEDMDLAYKLHAAGVGFGLVDDGWSYEIPHARADIGWRESMERRGWEISYRKHKSLELEVERYSEENEVELEGLIDYLSYAGKASQAPGAISGNFTEPGGRPTLVVGGGEADVAANTFVTYPGLLGDVSPTCWRFLGLLMPLDDDSMGTVLIGDVWKWLAAAPESLGGLRLLEALIGESARVAPRIVFVDSEGLLPAGATHSAVTSFLDSTFAGTLLNSDVVVEVCARG